MKTFSQHLNEVKANDKILKAIADGGFKRDTTKALLADMDKIINKYTKGDEWDISKNARERGVVWTGEDEKAAQKNVKNIIGDMYDYFSKASQKKKPNIKKTDVNGYTSYAVRGWNEKEKSYVTSQITFFTKDKFNSGDSVIGFLTEPK